MSAEIRTRLFNELQSIVLIDPHTHINALNPASETLADLLGYHYYTELAHSAGMPKAQIEEPGIDPKEKVARLMANLGPLDNTIQYSWLVEMAREFFDFDGDRIDAHNWEPVYDAALAKMQQPDWAQQVLQKSGLEAVFLTNDFDDPLTGFDTSVYIPCLRTDDLVFHLARPDVRQRLAQATGVAVADAATLRAAVGKLFEHFVARGARACAISLPPDFTPLRPTPSEADVAVKAACNEALALGDDERMVVARFVFWTLAEHCADFGLPFDLMIGVNRRVYPEGVFQGQDLYDSRVSLLQYKDLFNAFGQVTFPISVLASVTNQELASYAWIFPNVATNGHWWYSNTPTFIEHDAAARLECVPRTKQIGYYSDMYKLEFALPKFNMYKRILAKILAERYVVDRGWSEERAIEFGRQVLRGNVETIFPAVPARA
ncbi:MAG: glucuronate isomerase [Planctomycetales bacterium]|nr:glucuronate isomerase [Planctomycetales bacterium]